MFSSSNTEYKKLCAVFNSEQDLKDFGCRYCDLRPVKIIKYRILQEDKPTIIGVLSKGSVVSEMEVDNSYYSELVGALLHHGGRMINEGHLDW
ncbi:hypothetical protein [Aphanizomenon flos-aquae]|jgi:hypothetical protein|uniref:hypothetical protein n=1 Tax=Aphanizomenon flos-aquae TaxID=1176 RepID=UPI0007FCB6E1|nr:hypothetical protein [Aphanizomenon flos-aquae]OBQ27627.1 MAG: hypothetical protein AN483_19720 [Aphanizomenon flos-aquae MDT14a]MBD2392627.1 hypothetical protein [Aphanizomenon flos-aquae FACHB-1171]MBD2559007.1 hypothetical protein [Aphanizomenon flos-aquae FACHB-1290]MBD2659308.1 hypothetical protein [Aphanizomenon flos-aquae FACHB-1265]MBD2698987.1 hypothetical protein [Aphanizomenon flos-aquae FACHB-1287]